MPSQTRSSLETLTSLLIGDPSQRRFTSAQVLAKLQEAQERFVLDTRVLRDSALDSTVVNQAEYDLPSDVMDIERLALDGVEKERISKAEMDFKSSVRWDQTAGTPQYYYVDLDPNNKKFGFYPYPDKAGTNNIAIEYVKIPPTLSSGESVPLDGHTLLTPYHNSLAYWSAKELLQIDPSEQNLFKAASFLKRYQDEVSQCIETFKHMSVSQSWRMLGGRYHKGL